MGRSEMFWKASQVDKHVVRNQIRSSDYNKSTEYIYKKKGVTRASAEKGKRMEAKERR